MSDKAVQQLAESIKTGNPQLAAALAEALAGAGEGMGGTSYTKAEANYRRADGEEKCGNCMHYDSSAETCSIVSGNINPEDTCDYWKGSTPTSTDSTGQPESTPQQSTSETPSTPSKSESISSNAKDKKRDLES